MPIGRLEAGAERELETPLFDAAGRAPCKVEYSVAWGGYQGKACGTWWDSNFQCFDRDVREWRVRVGEKT
jgi:hypothetical protein